MIKLLTKKNSDATTYLHFLKFTYDNLMEESFIDYRIPFVTSDHIVRLIDRFLIKLLLMLQS